MRYFITLFLFLAGISGVFAQTGNQVVFKFSHKAGTEAMEINQTVFPIWNNKKIVLNRAEFYIAEIELIRADSSVVPLTDVYLLAGADYPGLSFPVGEWPVNEVIGITLHIGVDSAHNHLDPSTYPLGHPLGHQKNSMHWGWTVGYRFMAVEGMVDNNGDNIPESELQFHNIGDDLYRAARLTGLAKAANGVLELHLELDYARLFNNMSMNGSLTEHGNSDMNHLMMDNAATGGFLKFLNTSSAAETEANAAKIRISPNPASSGALIQCDLPGMGPLDMTVINALGQTVMTKHQIPASGAVQVETETLPNGIYHCVFYETGRFITRKPFVVHH